MRFRFYYKELGGHTHIRVFCGPSTPEDGTLGKSGDLVMTNQEFAEFRTSIYEAMLCRWEAVHLLTPQNQFEFEEDNV